MAAVPMTGTPLDFINAGSALLGAVGGLNAKPAAPGIATSGGPLANKADVDFSGFTVATGNARADGARINKTTADALGPNQVPSVLSAGIASAVDSGALWVVAGIAGVAVLWRILSK